MSTTTYTSRVKYKDHIHTPMTAKVNRKLVAEIDWDDRWLGRPAYANIYKNDVKVQSFHGKNAVDAINQAKQWLDEEDIAMQQLKTNK